MVRLARTPRGRITTPLDTTRRDSAPVAPQEPLAIPEQPKVVQKQKAVPEQKAAERQLPAEYYSALAELEKVNTEMARLREQRERTGVMVQTAEEGRLGVKQWELENRVQYFGQEHGEPVQTGEKVFVGETGKVYTQAEIEAYGHKSAEEMAEAAKGRGITGGYVGLASPEQIASIKAGEAGVTVEGLPALPQRGEEVFVGGETGHIYTQDELKALGYSSPEAAAAAAEKRAKGAGVEPGYVGLATPEQIEQSRDNEKWVADVLPTLPDVLQTAYRKGGVEAYNEAVEKYNERPPEQETQASVPTKPGAKVVGGTITIGKPEARTPSQILTTEKVFVEEGGKVYSQADLKVLGYDTPEEARNAFALQKKAGRVALKVYFDAGEFFGYVKDGVAKLAELGKPFVAPLEKWAKWVEPIPDQAKEYVQYMKESVLLPPSFKNELQQAQKDYNDTLLSLGQPAPDGSVLISKEDADVVEGKQARLEELERIKGAVLSRPVIDLLADYGAKAAGAYGIEGGTPLFTEAEVKEINERVRQQVLEAGGELKYYGRVLTTIGRDAGEWILRAAPVTSVIMTIKDWDKMSEFEKVTSVAFDVLINASIARGTVRGIVKSPVSKAVTKATFEGMGKTARAITEHIAEKEAKTAGYTVKKFKALRPEVRKEITPIGKRLENIVAKLNKNELASASTELNSALRALRALEEKMIASPVPITAEFKKAFAQAKLGAEALTRSLVAREMRQAIGTSREAAKAMMAKPSDPLTPRLKKALSLAEAKGAALFRAMWRDITKEAVDAQKAYIKGQAIRGATKDLPPITPRAKGGKITLPDSPVETPAVSRSALTPQQAKIVNVYNKIVKDNAYDVDIPAAEFGLKTKLPSSGHKLHIYGENAADAVEALLRTKNYLIEKGIDFKVALSDRFTLLKSTDPAIMAQGNKAMTIYIPKGMDVAKVATDLNKLLNGYKPKGLIKGDIDVTGALKYRYELGPTGKYIEAGRQPAIPSHIQDPFKTVREVPKFNIKALSLSVVDRFEALAKALGQKEIEAVSVSPQIKKVVDEAILAYVSAMRKAGYIKRATAKNMASGLKDLQKALATGDRDSLRYALNQLEILAAEGKNKEAMASFLSKLKQLSEQDVAGRIRQASELHERIYRGKTKPMLQESFLYYEEGLKPKVSRLKGKPPDGGKGAVRLGRGKPKSPEPKTGLPPWPKEPAQPFPEWDIGFEYTPEVRTLDWLRQIERDTGRGTGLKQAVRTASAPVKAPEKPAPAKPAPEPKPEPKPLPKPEPVGPRIKPRPAPKVKPVRVPFPIIPGKPVPEVQPIQPTTPIPPFKKPSKPGVVAPEKVPSKTPSEVPIIKPSKVDKPLPQKVPKYLPAKQPKPAQSPKPTPKPAITPSPTPTPLPKPMPQPLPQPQLAPSPVPEPKPKPQPLPKPMLETPTKLKPKIIPKLKPGASEAKKRELVRQTPGAVAQNMGKLGRKNPQDIWHVWLPDGEHIVLRGSPPEGAEILAEGKGSAYETTQTIGGKAAFPITYQHGAVITTITPSTVGKGAVARFTPARRTLPKISKKLLSRRGRR